ncbi:MAG: sodium ion-translocating decarboxylase subunit beta [Oscillospiraceae bacterium]|jgi:oxaloacetate decarboxylase beta subunit|nr:sodium ion-translocating decarboxylase subunit beta [Oscillospiraceae bacterium]
MQVFTESIKELWEKSGFVNGSLLELIMLAISLVLIYLAIAKKYEPLLLLPIAVGMLLTNIPGANMFNPAFFSGEEVNFAQVFNQGGLLDILYIGVKLQIFPLLIFFGVGCMTDFGPLIANPSSFLLGAAAQAGIFLTFLGAFALGFPLNESASIAIIGSADGPTTIWLTTRLAPEMLGPIAIAAYSYMALIPVIQPPVMKLLTTKKERAVRMAQLRFVSKKERIFFPIIVTVLVGFIIPDALGLVGMLMFGNLFKESGVVDRLVKTSQNELANIVIIMLGMAVGATAKAENFLNGRTLMIIGLGLTAFILSTACGVLFGKLMYLFGGKKTNPLIGSAGVSALPMAARVTQKIGQEADPGNYLLMHAMGPTVSAIIGSAVVAGIMFSLSGV